MNEQNEMNLSGSLDLIRMENACIITVPGKTATKRGVFIPIEENDIFVTKDEFTGKTKAAYYNMNINQRREVSERGSTHYAKPAVSKKFAEQFPELAEKRRNTYLGDFKPFVFEGGNAVNSVEAPVVQPQPDDDMPF